MVVWKLEAAQEDKISADSCCIGEAPCGMTLTNLVRMATNAVVVISSSSYVYDVSISGGLFYLFAVVVMKLKGRNCI